MTINSSTQLVDDNKHIHVCLMVHELHPRARLDPRRRMFPEMKYLGREMGLSFYLISTDSDFYFKNTASYYYNKYLNNILNELENNGKTSI